MKKEIHRILRAAIPFALSAGVLTAPAAAPAQADETRSVADPGAALDRQQNKLTQLKKFYCTSSGSWDRKTGWPLFHDIVKACEVIDRHNLLSHERITEMRVRMMRGQKLDSHNLATLAASNLVYRLKDGHTRIDGLLKRPVRDLERGRSGLILVFNHFEGKNPDAILLTQYLNQYDQYMSRKRPALQPGR